jgi:hypothetical protein
MLGAIWQTIVFYGLCVKWAATGTVERANAWFWLVGVPIVAFAGWYFGLGELHVPDQPAGFVTFMVVTVFVTWLIFFAIRLLRAPAHLYEGAKQETANAQASNLILHERLRPRINIFLNQTNQGVTLAPMEMPPEKPGDVPRKGPPAKYVQFCVSCATDAPLLECEGLLTSVHEIDPDNKIIGPELVEEHINCAWSQMTDIKITIPPLRVNYVNLFIVLERPHDPTGWQVLPETRPMKIRLRDAIQIPGRYRLDVLVTATSAPSKTERFIFEWHDFDHVTLELMP